MSMTTNATAALLDQLRQSGDWSPLSQYSDTDQNRIAQLHRANLVSRQTRKQLQRRPDGYSAMMEVAYYRFIPFPDLRSVQLLAVLYATDQPITLTDLQQQLRAKPWGSRECIRTIISYAEMHGLVDVVKAGSHRLFAQTATGRAYLQSRESAA